MNTFNRFACITLFSMTCMIDVLLGQESALKIESQMANYDGQVMKLSGNVLVENDLARMEAQQIELTCQSIDNSKEYLLKLQGKVKISLPQGGSLTSALAEIDCRERQGKFYSDETQQEVVYTDTKMDKQGLPISLRVKSHQMTIQLGTSQTSTKAALHSLIAQGNATATYNDTFTVTGEDAIYENETIVFRPKDSEGFCQVTHISGDIIQAQQIDINTSQKSFSFLRPKGVLHPSFGKKSHPYRIDFSCDRLHWDDNLHQLRLSDNNVVHLQGIGTLINDQEMLLSQLSQNGELIQPIFQAKGKTTLSYTKNEVDNSLTCDGLITVDSKEKILVMKPEGDHQIIFRDPMGEIRGNLLAIEYALGQDKILHPEKMTLKGDVRLLNRSALDPEKPQAFFEYILADQMEYIPDTKEVHLTAYHPHRVLLYDRVNHLQVSAPEIKLRRNQQTQKDSFEGIGDVRFNFTEEEAAQLRAHGMNEG